MQKDLPPFLLAMQDPIVWMDVPSFIITISLFMGSSAHSKAKDCQSLVKLACLLSISFYGGWSVGFLNVEGVKEYS